MRLHDDQGRRLGRTSNAPASYEFPARTPEYAMDQKCLSTRAARNLAIEPHVSFAHLTGLGAKISQLVAIFVDPDSLTPRGSRRTGAESSAFFVWYRCHQKPSSARPRANACHHNHMIRKRRRGRTATTCATGVATPERFTTCGRTPTCRTFPGDFKPARSAWLASAPEASLRSMRTNCRVQNLTRSASVALRGVPYVKYAYCPGTV
jgi:hypothetical protein